MKYCVIGLGKFGYALAKELTLEGHEVLAVDTRQSRVDSLKDEVSVAVRADASDMDALRELGADECDAAVICIGEQFEASLMATSHLKSFEIEKIYCRVINSVHEHLIKLVGVTEVIEPETEAAQQFAKRLGIERAKQRFTLSGDYAIVEVAVPESFVGKKIGEIDMAEEHRLTLITIRKNDREEGEEEDEDDSSDPKGIRGVLDPEEEFEEGDYLVVFGHEDDVEKFSSGE